MRIAKSIAVAALLLPSLSNAQTNSYGAIDVGSKGVKAFIYSIDREGRETSVLFSKAINTKLAGSMTGSRFSPEGIQEVADASLNLLQDLRAKAAEKKLPNVIYFIVGSSAVKEAKNKDELAAAVNKATGVTMDFVEAREEGYFGLLSAIPRDDRSIAIFVDIGSGNTKLGCLVGESDAKSFKSVEIHYGAVSGRNAAKQDPTNIMTGIERLMHDEVLPAYSKESMDIPCLRNRKKIYWIGGTAWATATLMHPDRALHQLVAITRSDLDAFLNRLGDGTWNQKELAVNFPKNIPQNLQKKIKTQAEVDRNRVMDTFITEDLFSGVSIMKVVLDVSNPSASISYARDSNYTLGYALEKYKENRGKPTLKGSQ